MMGSGYGMGWGAWLLMGGATVLFWAVVAVVVVALLSGRRGSEGRPDPDPLKTLDQRLASGELTPEEYEQRRALIFPRR